MREVVQINMSSAADRYEGAVQEINMREVVQEHGLAQADILITTCPPSVLLQMAPL